MTLSTNITRAIVETRADLQHNVAKRDVRGLN